MSTTEGRMDCMNVVDLSFSDGGRSLRVEMRASIPPYQSTTMTIRNAFCIKLSQSPDDEYPYFLPEIRWRIVAANNSEDVLREAKYDFFDETGNPLIGGRELVVLEMEGALCGQIIAEGLSLE
jgi:hypothetical protein